MRIHVIAIGNRMPAWVETAFAEYAKRMPAHRRLRLHEVPARKRTKGVDIERLLKDECARIQAATPKGCYVVALERTGRELDTGEHTFGILGKRCFNPIRSCLCPRT